MSTDITQQLRSQMEHVQVRVPPGLVRQAFRGYRRRRLAVRAAAAAGMAAIVGTGTVVATGVAHSGPAIAPAQTTAYVVSHVSSALAGTNSIAYLQAQYIAPGNVPWAVQQVWTYHWAIRVMNLTPAGKPVYDISVGPPDVTVAGQQVKNVRVGPVDTGVRVNYQARTWYEDHGGRLYTVVTNSCAQAFVLYIGEAANDLKTGIETGLRCGDLRVSGRQVIAGVDAIELTSSRKAATPLTIWVNPDSYLPMQLAEFPKTPVPYTELTSDGVLVTTYVRIREIRAVFSWLPPTKGNLRLLTAPIPHGFRRVVP